MIKILNTESEELVDKYNWFYIPKRDGNFLKRNAIIALANNPSKNSRKTFIDLINSESELIRFYCIWALWRIGEFDLVNQYLDIDNDESTLVLTEYQRLNEMIYSNK